MIPKELNPAESRDWAQKQLFPQVNFQMRLQPQRQLTLNLLEDPEPQHPDKLHPDFEPTEAEKINVLLF